MGRIVVTGMGIITAIGNTVAENRNSLINKTCGITSLQLVDTKYAHQLPCGEIKKDTETLKDDLDAHDKGVTRTSLLALHACRDAIKNSGLSHKQITSFDTALINGTTVGGMCLTNELYEDAQRTEGGSEYLGSYDCASVTMYLQKKTGVQGIINTINTACSSSANTIMYGARLIKSGRAKRAIVGGVDSLSKFTINGFNALHILSPGICTPFDENRKGLNLGEGAAFLVLEKEEDAVGKTIYGAVAGYGNTNDAFHPSSLSDEGDGPFLCMQAALQTAGLESTDIGFINAHGTGTENNDLVESIAMKRLFETPPPFISAKSYTGHTLGAAGAVQAVYSLLSLHHQEIYAGLNFTDPIPATGLMPVTEYFLTDELNHVMSNSFGFGGNCSSLIFSKV